MAIFSNRQQMLKIARFRNANSETFPMRLPNQTRARRGNSGNTQLTFLQNLNIAWEHVVL